MLSCTLKVLVYTGFLARQQIHNIKDQNSPVGDKLPEDIPNVKWGGNGGIWEKRGEMGESVGKRWCNRSPASGQCVGRYPWSLVASSWQARSATAIKEMCHGST